MIKTLKSTSLVTAISLLLISCGGSSDSSKSTDSTAQPNNGSTSSGKIKSDALAKTALSSLYSASKTASSSVTNSKILSSGVKYKITTTPCPNGGNTTMDFGNFDPSTGEMPSNFTITYNQCKSIQNNSESYINGKLTMSFDVNNPTSYSNYTFLIGDGYFINENDRLDLKDYKVISTGDEKKVTMKADGKFKTTTCLDEWISFKTPETIVILTGDSCPTAGKMTVSTGGSQSSITYNNDQSIDISGNGTSQHYDNCNDLDSIDDTTMCK